MDADRAGEIGGAPDEVASAGVSSNPFEWVMGALLIAQLAMFAAWAAGF